MPAALAGLHLFAVSVVMAGCLGSAPRDQAASRNFADAQPFAISSDSAALAHGVAAIDSAIGVRRAQLAVPGVAVSIVTAERVLLNRGYGKRDVAAGLPVTDRTLFVLGSCTKPFTALATVIAADHGRLSLEDSPRRFLPWFALREANANAHVALRDLLSHRTGVPDDLGGGWYERYGTRERLIRAAMQSAPQGAFRRAFHYNNYMYLAAGEALAVASGMSYERTITQTVLEPLGMHDSGFSLDSMEASADFSYGYEDTARTRVKPTRLVYNTAIAPAANLHSNANNMAQWLRMFAGGGVLDGRRLVSDSGMHEILTPQVRTAGGSYALGWFVENWHGLRLYSHPGGVTGFGTRCEFLPDQRLGWVVLSNVDDQQLPKAIREMVYSNLLAPR